jgi:4-oxalocrotonate tautomerase family enzyme
MPIIHIYAKNNKSIAQKRAMAREVTAAVVKNSEATAEQVQIFWHAIDPENYARGGVLSSERKKSKVFGPTLGRAASRRRK